MSPKKILITGATGLVGSHLTSYLRSSGYTVVTMGRTTSHGRVDFEWDVEVGQADEKALNGVDAIVHLAGANVGAKRWTKRWKAEIMNSRVNSTTLLYNLLSRNTHQVTTFVGASGVGYYGLSDEDVVFRESDPPGSDFLAQVVVKWEAEEDRISELGIRVVKLRTAVVLDSSAGALPSILKMIKWNVGAILGTGHQYFPWIHIDDLCALYRFTMEHSELTGAFNAVAQESVTNEIFTHSVAASIGKKIWLPHVPAFALRMAVGEMSKYLLGGNRVAPDKILTAGFRFQYDNLQKAISALMNH